MTFFTELKRRNVFRVAAAYAVVAWLLIQVGDIAADSLGFPGWFMPIKELCRNNPFVRDAMNFYAIHDVNLRISREMQANRDTFQSALRAEMGRVR